MSELQVRPLAAGDDQAIRDTFRSTLLLGDPPPFALPDLDRYEALCLDWYLGPGRRWGAVVTDEHGGVLGYLLACLDTAAQSRWARRPALRFTARVATGMLTGRYDRPARTFWRLRLQDGWRGWRHGAPPPFPMHVHLNLVPGVRATTAGRLLVAHADQVCRTHGLAGWFGEVNAVAGRRAAAFERLGATVVQRTPNLTFSWALGTPVERLTVVRTLPEQALAPRVLPGPAARGQSSRDSRRRSTVASPTPIPAT